MEFHLAMGEEPSESLWCSSHTTQVTEGKGRDQENKVLATVGKDQVRDQLRNLKLRKSMGPDELHLQVLTELTD
ncbi:rna-directed dna polymerase from mobile element hypothetical protein [Limosa lapponica baueri]|uniref:Uncharacterized protein n=1 Tax=Limosa lapponica baueri TaxID=1758121 RepID=A0A2I0UFN9_LIMLA|nr:rna-directed dna polymerase from mobile element hypothetical protein [Limosa lapponica baueri]